MIARLTRPLAVLLACAACTAVQAQWVSQSFTLGAGWNAIYLEVSPAAHLTAAQVLVTQPADAIERVWMWVPPGASDVADQPTSDDTRWRVWIPSGDANSVANSTFRVEGGRTYLIKTTLSGGQTATLTIVGTPSGEKQRTLVGLNLFGFRVDGSGQATFGSYLAPSGAFDTDPGTAGHQLQIYSIDPATGGPVPIANAATTPIVQGRAYWVRAVAAVEYDGPLSVDVRSLAGVTYGVTGDEHRFDVENLSSTPKSVTLAYAASLTPPAGTPTLPNDAGGAIPLLYRQYVGGQTLFQRSPLALGGQVPPIALSAVSDGNNRRRILWINCNRGGRSMATVDPATGLGSMYQGLLTITDGAGFRRWIAVTAEVAGQAGLYVGYVTLNSAQWVQADARILTVPREQVNYGSGEPTDVPGVDDNPASDNDNTRLRPTAQTFTFPVLVHFDGVSTYKLLTQATLMHNPGDENTPGHSVIVTPACTSCGDLLPGGLAGSEGFKQRFATAAFSFAGDLTLQGGFGSTLELAAPIVIAPTDPLNPFRHKFHPSHDVALGGTVYQVTRSPRFLFTCPPEGSTGEPPGMGDRVLRGCYEETFTGLHKRSITVGGRFELRRVSNIAVLNDGR